MNRGTMQVFLLLFSSLVFVINNCQPLPEPDTLIVAYGNDGLTSLSLIFQRTSNDIFTTPNSGKIQVRNNFHFYPPKNMIKHRQFRKKIPPTEGSNSNASSEEMENSDFDSTLKRRAKRLNKRNGTGNSKQKKAKELRRLLMENDSNKREEEDRDDYDLDRDDDYYKQTKKQKMKWEDYQNEDGASIMELIALNDRHKNHYNEYLN